MIEGSEACDDGVNNSDSTYEGCTTDCRFGPYCGDGITTAPEICDLGAGNGPSYSIAPTGGCTLSCTNPHYCGDGSVDSAFGEQCDLGAKNGQAIGDGGGKTCVVCDTSCRLVVDCP